VRCRGRLPTIVPVFGNRSRLCDEGLAIYRALVVYQFLITEKDE